MNPWSILETFENLNQMAKPTQGCLAAMSDYSARQAPSPEWDALKALDISKNLDELEGWLPKILEEAASRVSCKAIYFLIADAQFEDGSWGHELCAYEAEEFFDEDGYDEWESAESLGCAPSSVFDGVSDMAEKLVEIDPMADYALPLIYTGGAIYEACRRLANSGKADLPKKIGFGVGWFFGDAFNLGMIGENKVTHAAERLA